MTEKYTTNHMLIYLIFCLYSMGGAPLLATGTSGSTQASGSRGYACRLFVVRMAMTDFILSSLAASGLATGGGGMDGGGGGYNQQ